MGDWAAPPSLPHPCSRAPEVRLTSLQKEAGERWGSQPSCQVQGCVSRKGAGIHVGPELWGVREWLITALTDPLGLPLHFLRPQALHSPWLHFSHSPQSHLGDEMGDQPQLLHLCG